MYCKIICFYTLSAEKYAYYFFVITRIGFVVHIYLTFVINFILFSSKLQHHTGSIKFDCVKYYP